MKLLFFVITFLLLDCVNPNKHFNRILSEIKPYRVKLYKKRDNGCIKFIWGVVNPQNVNMITQFVKNRYDQKTKTYE